QPALYEKPFSQDGLQWIEYNDRANSAISFIRKVHNAQQDLIVVLNCTPVARERPSVGVPKTRPVKLLFNSDDADYSGSGEGRGTLKVEAEPWNGQEHSVLMDLAPLGIVVYQ